jgi:hypothetical protein
VRGHGLGALTVHVPFGPMRPVGPILQVNSRPDCSRPLHVHDAAPRGEQFTLATVNPCALATARAFSAACPAGVFVPKHPASNSAGAKAAASGVTLRTIARGDRVVTGTT